MENIQQEFLRHLLEVFRGDCDNSSTLYHYTSLNSGLCILKSRRIYLSDFRSMNDQEEINHGLGLIKEVISSCGEHTELNEFHTCLTTILNHKETKILTFSCMKEPNSKIGWEYADKGAGIAIGLKRKCIEDKLSDLMYSDVIYNEKEQRLFILKLLNIYKDYKRLYPGISYNSFYPALFIIFSLLVSTYKKNINSNGRSWELEKEWRGVSPHVFLPKQKKYILKELPKPVSDEELPKPMYDLFDFDYNDMEKVIIGSRANFESVKGEFQRLLCLDMNSELLFRIINGENY